ncbi:MAG TPA: ATP-binding protein [Acidimicrobiia bacterium]|jgi:signal transduction histidine kinase
MDQLPVEISQRIRHEARVAGLREARSPSIEMVERRRMQLWFLTFVIVIVLGLATLVASWTTGNVGLISGEPWILRSAVAALGLGFCFYAVEKEIHLHRLSRLLVDERVLNSAMANRLQMNAALFNAGKALNSVLDLDEVLDAILANALDLLGGATGSVMLVADEESLRVVAVRGSRLARDARVKLGESIAGRVATSREPLLISGVVGPGDFPGYEDREQTTSSAMCVPLVNRGQLLGVLNVSASSERDFDEHDLQILSLFAEPVAAAIAKAGLYEAERAHVAQLLDTDRMKTQFVASVSHELRTPITSIRGAVAASRRSITPEQRVELLEVIERQSLRLQSMVEEIFTAAKMEQDGNRPLLRRIDLAALVRLAALDSQVAGRPVEVEAPTACEVRADPEAVRRIVGNLIENAHKYGATPVRITVQPAEEQVVLSVVDHGAGVPLDEREKVFERFYRADPNGTKPGMGLGLAIVRGLVESCGGSVWVEDAPGGGAAFRVALRTGATESSEREVARVG